jgi:glycosyltransferase involved in cell wall biosynthesis
VIDGRDPNFAFTPAAPGRPRVVRAPLDPTAAPAASVVTPFYRAGPLFHETMQCLLHQTLQRWEWIIVDDASSDPESKALLEGLRGTDPRIRILQHERNRGRSAARNTGFAAARSGFVYLLDQDDLLEPTTLEKCLWCLASHPESSFVNTWSVGFGAQEYLWNQGFELGAGFLQENFATGRAMVRKQVLEAVGGFDQELVDGFEDWDLWLRCADRGFWGTTIPEYLDWFRRRDPPSAWEDPARKAAFRKTLRSRYPGLYADGFPSFRTLGSAPFDPVTDELPCENRLADGSPRVLMIVPWLTLGGADRFNLELVRGLSQRGYEVSIATTLAGDHSWAPEFAKHTPDLHMLHHFLAPHDHPRYLRYLIESRRPQLVLLSHSELGYLVLPYLRSHCPEPAYVDFCHVEEEGWRNGGYPRHSVAMQSCLDRTLVSSQHLEAWMTARGADPEHVEVVHTGVDTEAWCPRPESRSRLRQAWGVAEDEPVVLHAARLCAQKQPHVLAQTLLALSRRNVRFHAVIAGEGEARPWLEQFFRDHALGARVRFLGAIPPDEMRDVMSASDVFFLPSRWEGIALSLYEAAAMELAIVSADVGGQRELLSAYYGILLPPGDEEREIEQYSLSLASLLPDAERRRELGRRARDRVSKEFRIEETLERMMRLFEKARNTERRAALPPDLAREWATQAVEYLRIGAHAGALEAHLARALHAEARLAQVEASRAYRLVRKLKRSSPYRLYARWRYGPGWELQAP